MFAWRRTLYRHRVLLTTRTGRTFAGIVWVRRGPLLILIDAEAVDGGRQVPLDGQLVIDRANVDFVQVLPPEPPN